jgi:hypothetical protein
LCIPDVVDGGKADDYGQKVSFSSSSSSSSSSWIRNNVITMCGIMFDSSQLKSNILEGIVTRYYNKGLGNISKGRKKKEIEFVIVPCRTDPWVCSNL